MAILTFEVKGQTLTVKSSIGRIVENSVNYLDYDIVADWGANITRNLIISSGNISAMQKINEPIDESLIKAPGFQATVIGIYRPHNPDNNNCPKKTNSEKGLCNCPIKTQITTNPVFINISPSGATEGESLDEEIFTQKFADAAVTTLNSLSEKVGNNEQGLVKDVEDLKNNKLNVSTFNDEKSTLQNNIDSKVDQSMFVNHVNNKVTSVEANETSDDKYPTTKAVSDFVGSSISDTKLEIKNNIDREIDILKKEEEAHGVVLLDELPLRDYKIVWSGEKWHKTDTNLDYYKHSLLKISPNQFNKNISIEPKENSYSEIAFLKDFSEGYDYSKDKPPYVDDTSLITEIKTQADYLIPQGTSWLYISRRKDSLIDLVPSKLEIDGYDYCSGVTHNILEQKKLLNENIQSVQESLDTHINNKVENFEGNTDSNDKYPSVKAVYDFVNQSEHITKLTATNIYIWDLPPGIYTFTATNKVQRIYFSAGVNHACDEGAFLIVGGENHSGNLPAATTFKKSVIFLKNLNTTIAQIITGISTVTYTIAEDGKVTYTAEWDGGIIESQDNKINAINSDVTINQYPSAKAVYSYVEEKANKISSNSTNALKGNVSDKGIIDISDISPIEHDLQVSVTMGSANVVGIPVVCRGKNLFGLEGRIETTFNKVQHNFTGNSVFLSYSPSNNVGSSGSFTYDPQKEEIVYNNTSSDWYGLGVDIKVDPSTYYFISQQELSALGNIGVAFYDSDGVYIGWTKEYNLTKAFQTPENAAWAVIALVCKTKNEQATFTKVQLEKGMVATSFEKYSPPQSRTTNSNGEAIGFRSIHPRTIIETQNPQLTINCEYNKDINKAYEELQSNYKKLKTAIENLGGKIE